MPDEAVDLVRDILRRWNAGERDIEAAIRVHRDFELTGPLASVRGEPYRGLTGLQEWIAEVDSNFDHWRVEVEDVRAVRNSVLAVGQLHLRGRGGHVALNQPGAWIFEFEDAQLRRLQFYLEPKDALRALGLQG
jgi:ketosteroid isomerase-like protein